MEVKKQAIMPGYHMHVWYNKKQLPTFSLWATWLSNTGSHMTAMIKCLWCIVSWKESRIWNFGCARADYIILI
jgi:hypothetical protein